MGHPLAAAGSWVNPAEKGGLVHDRYIDTTNLVRQVDEDSLTHPQ